MPEDEWVTSEVDGKVKKTMGKINLDLQISKFNSNALPLYAIVDSQGNEMVDTYSYNPDPDDLVDYLERGLENYNDAN
jgi:thiol:disulfide interchange protein DsbD